MNKKHEPNIEKICFLIKFSLPFPCEDQSWSLLRKLGENVHVDGDSTCDSQTLSYKKHSGEEFFQRKFRSSKMQSIITLLFLSYVIMNVIEAHTPFDNKKLQKETIKLTQDNSKYGNIFSRRSAQFPCFPCCFCDLPIHSIQKSTKGSSIPTTTSSFRKFSTTRQSTENDITQTIIQAIILILIIIEGFIVSVIGDYTDHFSLVHWFLDIVVPW